jgi:hypothetical protein
VIQCTLIHKKDNSDDERILINVLEFVFVIINYCALLHVFATSTITENPHPVLLSITNNASALSWTNHTCIKSRIGQLLAQFFCSPLINPPLGLNSQWMSTDNKKIVNNVQQTGMATLIQEAVKRVCPGITIEDLKSTPLILYGFGHAPLWTKWARVTTTSKSALVRWAIPFACISMIK